jgi:hypothetical protein
VERAVDGGAVAVEHEDAGAGGRQRRSGEQIGRDQQLDRRQPDAASFELRRQDETAVGPQQGERYRRDRAQQLLRAVMQGPGATIQQLRQQRADRGPLEHASQIEQHDEQRREQPERRREDRLQR